MSPRMCFAAAAVNKYQISILGGCNKFFFSYDRVVFDERRMTCTGKRDLANRDGFVSNGNACHAVNSDVFVRISRQGKSHFICRFQKDDTELSVLKQYE